ncbi:MAG: hypothetical protein RMJ88_14010, partial [Thermogemmata sp.]|nr:hypothetical protein [Thermogemmata sp.]
RSSQGQIQRTGRTALISGLGVLLLCFVFFIWFAQSPPRGLTPRSGESDSRLFVTNMSEAEIVKKLDELDGLLKAHPREGNLPTVEEARRLNRHLQWLVQRLDLESGEDKGLSDKTRQRMNAALNSITDLISKKYSANREIPGNLTAVLAAYLEDLPDLEPRSKALSDLQANYWGLRRILIEQDIGSIIKRRRAVQSPPTDTLSEILEKLRNLEADVKRDKVFAKKVAGSSGTNLRQHLLNDIQTAVTFCEDRLKSKCYTAKLKITGHFKGVDECWRTLLIQSPGRNDVFSTDGISLKPLQDNGITVLTTKSSIYDVAFGLGVPVIMTLMVHQGQDQDGKDLWTKVSDFDISKHDGKIGPLEPMGLPLHRDKQYSRTFHWQPQGYELTITLTEMSPVPDLLWQAAEYAREKKP